MAGKALLETIKAKMIEDPRRTFRLSADGRNGRNGYKYRGDEVEAISPSEADIMFQQIIGKENDKYYNTCRGYHYPDWTFKEVYGPRKPIPESERLEAMKKGIAPKKYQRNGDGNTNWAYASEKEMKRNPEGGTWFEQKFVPQTDRHLVKPGEYEPKKASGRTLMFEKMLGK